METFPGQSVLGDLEWVPRTQALRVLIRYVALRAIILTDPVLVEVERPAARPYLALLPAEDPERRALSRALDLAGRSATDAGVATELAGALADAAVEATACAQLLGARALARAGFTVAGRHTNVRIRCTHLLADIATALSEPREAASWRRREAALRRRLERQDRDG